MPLQTAKILGSPTRRAWAQVHQFNELIALVAIEENEGEEMPTTSELGKELLTRLHEEYFGKDEGTVFERLIHSIETLADEFSGLDLTIIASVFWKGYVYFAISGEGQIWLLRDGKLHQLLAGNGKTKSLSGRARLQDIFLLGTDKFFQVVNQNDLSTIFMNKATLSDIADNLAPLVHQQENGKAGALVFQVRKEDLAQGLDTVKENISADDTEGMEEYVDEIEKEEQQKPKVGIILQIKAKIIALFERLPTEYIKPTDNPTSRRRKVLLIGVILLALLGVSVVFGAKQKKERDYKMQYQGKLKEAQSLFDNAVLQKDINETSSRELYLKAKDVIDTLVQEGFKDPEIDKLKNKIVSQEQTILGRVNAQLSLFLDLSVVRSGIIAKQIVLGKNRLVVLDSGASRLISTSTDKKETSVVGGEDKTPKATRVAWYADKIYVLTNNGIVETTKNGATKTVVSSDDEWGEIGGMGVFGGNLYILTKSGKIWRYPATDAGFGAKQDWFAKDVSPDFSRIVDMAIDGSIWVLSANGQIGKFTRGARDTFKISGFDQTFSSAQAIYTDENLDSIFVLDRDKGAISEFDKKGAYKFQYLAAEIKDVVDFVVSKEAGKIFLLTETKILESPLK